MYLRLQDCFLTILLFLTLVSSVIANHTLIDPTDKQKKKVDSLISLCHKTYLKDIDASYHIVKQSLSMAEDIDYLFGVAQSKTYLGVHQVYRGNYIKALEYYFASINISKGLLLEPKITPKEQESYFHNLFFSYQLVSIVFNNLSQFDQQIKYLKLSEEYLLKTNYNEKQIIKHNTFKAMVYEELGLIDKSLEIYRTSLSFFKEENNTLVVAAIRNHIADVLILKEDYKNAIIENRIALEEATSIERTVTIISCLKTEAVINNKLGRYEKALSFTEKALKYEQSDESKANFYLVKSKSLMYLDRYKEAEKLLNESLFIYLNNDIDKQVIETARLLKDLYTKTSSAIKVSEMNQLIEKTENKLLKTKIEISPKEIEKLEMFGIEKVSTQKLTVLNKNTIKLLLFLGLILSILAISYSYLKKKKLNKEQV